jgi:CubicO group peptidase (beta-lactamase class C family)
LIIDTLAESSVAFEASQYHKQHQWVAIHMNTTKLDNWREPENSQYSFQNMQDLIACANISDPLPSASGKKANNLAAAPDMQATDGNQVSFETWLESSHTDGMLVLLRGEPVLRWHAPHYNPANPHVVFSVSKSITAVLAGILQDVGKLDLEAPVQEYITEIASSGYGRCTVRHLLDMTAAIDFDESYLDKTGQFARYRSSTGWNPVIPGFENETLRTFLADMKASGDPHGEVFKYLSPNSDLLGWVCENAAGMSYNEALAKYLWCPMGGTERAMVTIDQAGTARAAGGICATLDDLARIGELLRLDGQANNRTVVSADWVSDTRQGGDRQAWLKGDFIELLPNGKYRNKWYQVGNDSEAFAAIGIHGQWIYVDPLHEMTLVKLSSQPKPLMMELDLNQLVGFDRLGESLTDS